jgi:hypothetical protein
MIEPMEIKPAAADRAASDSESGSTLLPMLVGGLVLIVIGAVVVMTFV